MNKKTKKIIAVVIAILPLIIAFFVYDIGRTLRAIGVSIIIVIYIWALYEVFTL